MRREDGDAEGDEVSGTGTVSFVHLEGGFWAIRGDNSRVYDPMNLPSEFQQENLAVRFSGKVRRDIMSVHMVGDIIEITSIKRQGMGNRE